MCLLYSTLRNNASSASENISTVVVWYLETGCLILGVGFRGQARRWRDSWDQCLRVIAMTTNFGTEIVITGFVWTIVTGELVMEGGLSGRLKECRYYWHLAPKERCHGNPFWLPIYGVHIGATWRIRLNCPCAAAMRPYVELLLTICSFLYLIVGIPCETEVTRALISS